MAGEHLLGWLGNIYIRVGSSKNIQNTEHSWGAFSIMAGGHLLGWLGGHLLGLVALKTSRTQNTGGGHLL